MEEKRIRVAITHGDTNAVGYELIFKVFSEPTMLELCTPIIYGSPKIAAYHRKALDMQTTFTIINHPNEACEGKLNILPTFDEEIKVEIGVPSTEAGKAARIALEKAVSDYQNGFFDVLVTCPVNIQKMKEDGFPCNGQAEYIENQLQQQGKAINMLVCNDLKIGLATSQIPLAEVGKHITKELIVEKATALSNTLKRDFSISNPRIAVFALNPTHGDKQFVGSEEQNVIIPAVNELMEKRINAFGPFAADEFLKEQAYQHFDAMLALHEEQGAIPFKILGEEKNGVGYTAGLSLIRTAPDMDTLYNIAGKNVADENKLRHAIYLAIDTFRCRKNYDLPLANPLPKLYRERRDDSEKVRFAIPKKKEEDIQQEQSEE